MNCCTFNVQLHEFTETYEFALFFLNTNSFFFLYVKKRNSNEKISNGNRFVVLSIETLNLRALLSDSIGSRIKCIARHSAGYCFIDVYIMK